MTLLARAVLLAVLTLAVAVPAAQAAPPRVFVGMTADDLLGNGGAYRDKALDQQRSARVQLLRVTFNWAAIEIAPNNFDFTTYDKYILDAAARGITMLPVLFNAPDFYSSKPASGAKRGSYPPRDNADMARWATLLVKRYGPNGSIWQGHPKPLPLKAWQIWNEPTLPVYWRPRPSAKQYVAMLRTVGGAIKAEDPTAEIVTGGLPDSRLTGAVRLAPFIQQMYKARGGSAFDTMAINTYAVNARYMGKLMDTTRRVMNRAGGRADKMWITELGWCDKGPRSRFCVGVKGQARNIAASIKLIKQRRRAWKLRGFVLFSWRDGRPYGSGDQWGLHTGLLNLKGRKKPSYTAFTRGVRGL